MSGVGPFSIQTIVFLLTVCLTWLGVRLAVARRLPKGSARLAGRLIFDATIVGFVCARLAYIVLWWPEYVQTPQSMLAFGDGGYVVWFGWLAALGWVVWKTRQDRPLARVLVAGVVLSGLVWIGASTAVQTWQQQTVTPLPTLQLSTLDERSVDLQAYQGRPVVLNLWASWCPPCRREMPAFAKAQQLYPGVAFVMVNQGETESQVQDFLQKEGLQLTDVLLDPRSNSMRLLGARALPTTFFFDATGRLVDSHMGEMSLATLSSTLARHFVESLAQPQIAK